MLELVNLEDADAQTPAAGSDIQDAMAEADISGQENDEEAEACPALSDEERAYIAAIGKDESAFQKLSFPYQKLLYDSLIEKLYAPRYVSEYADLKLAHEMPPPSPEEISDREFRFVQFIANILSFLITEAKTHSYTLATNKLFPWFGYQYDDVISKFLNKQEFAEMEQVGSLTKEDLIEMARAQGFDVPDDEEEALEAAEPSEEELRQQEEQYREQIRQHLKEVRRHAEGDRSYYARLTGIERRELSRALDDALAHTALADTLARMEGPEEAKKQALSNLLARFIVEHTDETVHPTDRIELVLSNEYITEDELHDIARHVRQAYPYGAEIRRKARQAERLEQERQAALHAQGRGNIDMNVTFSPLEL